jgi:hypothetical protein
VQGERALYRCRAVALEDERQLLLFTVMPSLVPAARRSAAVELLTRVNLMIPVGNFELDFGDGEVRFKASVIADRGLVAIETVRTLLSVGPAMCDRYHDALASVAFAGLDAGRIVAKLEGGR